MLLLYACSYTFRVLLLLLNKIPLLNFLDHNNKTILPLLYHVNTYYYHNLLNVIIPIIIVKLQCSMTNVYYLCTFVKQHVLY